MTTTATMRQIVAVRVALLMRSASKEKDVVSPGTLTLFDGVLDASKNSLAQTVTLSATEDQYYRYRVVEFTIPLRNMLLLPCRFPSPCGRRASAESCCCSASSCS
jgi:type IV pilus assembly protein PilW